MLHLLPIRWLLVAFALYCGVVTLGATRYGTRTSASVDELWYLATALIGAPTALIVGVYLAWRFIKPFQMLVFPKLGGEWTGHISYQAKGKIKKKDAKLYVKHSFSGVVLVLETDESTSQTLVVSPQKDETGTQFKIYYVFDNHRKAQYCVPGMPMSYRGVAIIAFDRDYKQLSGQYFTEQNSGGNIEFRIVKPSWL